jgi:plasmid stabilization system protein ParE
VRTRWQRVKFECYFYGITGLGARVCACGGIGGRGGGGHGLHPEVRYSCSHVHVGIVDQVTLTHHNRHTAAALAAAALAVAAAAAAAAAAPRGRNEAELRDDYRDVAHGRGVVGQVQHLHARVNALSSHGCWQQWAGGAREIAREIAPV